MAIKISGTTIINDSRAILDHTSSVGTAGSILASTGSGICWKDAPSAGFSPDAQQNLYAGTGAGNASDADTCFNIGIGYSALYSQDASGSYDGERNVAIGCLAMCKATGGKEHVAIGRKAGAGLVAGYSNVFIGSYAGGDASCTLNSEFNIGLGYGALRGNTGHCNVSFGYEAQSLGNAAHNFTVGRMAGANVQSNNNVFIGECAARYTVTGNGNNIAIGKRAMHCAGGANHNTVLGNHAGKRITTGHCNIFMGYYAGSGDSGDVTGTNNVAIGTSAGFGLTSGSGHVLIGRCAGHEVTTNNTSVIIGEGAAQYGNSLSNVFIGFGAGCGVTGCTPAENAAVGCFAGRKIQGGTLNAFFGASAGCLNTSGHCNTVIGSEGAAALTTGSQNTILGSFGGYNVSTGSHNVAIGFCAQVASATGDKQLAIGCATSYWITGDSNFDIVTNNIVPTSNNTKNLGSTGTRWANIYTNDLQLSNEAKKDTGGNDVDGTWGDFTIQEGENDLFLINNRSGKKYKFNLTEVA